MALLRMFARFTEKGMGSYEIRYIRDREKREVDFTLGKDNKPVALFEAKESETGISPLYSEWVIIQLKFDLGNSPSRSDIPAFV
jgi:hypothetical protein